jgi:murein DD-endopeptidase MepM/ murein hydrolase activator NlpD
VNTPFARAGLLIGLFFFIITACVPSLADAATRRYRNPYSSKISQLDDDRVDDLFIPILFGVTLKTIYPNFGDPRGDGSREHAGLDIMAAEGTPIVSPTDAVVTRTGTGDNSGKYVNTANPGDETFVYMHLSDIEVEEGDVLEAGDLIGYVGNTGNASGGAAHLHFEVREDGDAMDPYERITEELSLEDKIEYLEKALEDADDEDDLAEFIADEYEADMRKAVAAGLELPELIAEELPSVVAPVVPFTPLPSGTASEDLQLGSHGNAVIVLQTFLITENTGTAARALSNAGATGYFGAITQQALIEYQAAHGITPAAGYYGPKTRAYIAAN